MSFKKRLDSLWTFEMMTLCLSHIENENVDSKKCHSNIKIKIKKTCHHK
jgi:hypothetical protein